jgi:hypothetical protein
MSIVAEFFQSNPIPTVGIKMLLGIFSVVYSPEAGSAIPRSSGRRERLMWGAYCQKNLSP